MSSETATEVGIVELSADEAAKAFDRIARREMGISSEEFLERWDAGEWRDIDMDGVPGLVDVWMALPMVRDRTTDARPNPS
jgi:hypothetical protein